MAAGLKALLGVLGLNLPGGSLVLTARTVVVSLVDRARRHVVAAISPARKAAKVPPVAAMQEATVGSTGYGSKQRVVVGLTILALGVAALFNGLFGHVGNAFLIVGLGVLLVFFGVSVLGRTIALPLSRVIGAPLPRVKGVTGTLARENTMRNPKRTAASASALMIGVGLVGFITIFASSATASINASIDRSFAGDFVINSGAGMAGGVDPALAQKLNTLPQVAAATGESTGSAVILGQVRADHGGRSWHGRPDLQRQPAAGVDQRPRRGRHRRLQGRGRPEPPQARRPRAGRVPGHRARQTLRVALIYGDSQAAPSANPGGKTRYFLGTPAYDANFSAPRYDTQVFVKKAPGVTTADALAAVKKLTAQYAVGATVMDQAAYKAEQTKGIGQLLALIYVLLALAIVIALLGIGNTLALSIFERTRELGVMRAVGMTRRQLRSTIRWESVIVALQGTVLGLAIGVFFGWALVLAQKSQGITTFSVPYLTLVIVVLLAGAGRRGGGDPAQPPGGQAEHPASRRHRMKSHVNRLVLHIASCPGDKPAFAVRADQGREPDSAWKPPREGVSPPGRTSPDS